MAAEVGIAVVALVDGHNDVAVLVNNHRRNAIETAVVARRTEQEMLLVEHLHTLTRRFANRRHVEFVRFTGASIGNLRQIGLEDFFEFRIVFHRGAKPEIVLAGGHSADVDAGSAADFVGSAQRRRRNVGDEFRGIGLVDIETADVCPCRGIQAHGEGGVGDGLNRFDIHTEHQRIGVAASTGLIATLDGYVALKQGDALINLGQRHGEEGKVVVAIDFRRNCRVPTHHCGIAAAHVVGIENHVGRTALHVEMAGCGGNFLDDEFLLRLSRHRHVFTMVDGSDVVTQTRLDVEFAVAGIDESHQVMGIGRCHAVRSRRCVVKRVRRGPFIDVAVLVGLRATVEHHIPLTRRQRLSIIG